MVKLFCLTAVLIQTAISAAVESPSNTTGPLLALPFSTFVGTTFNGITSFKGIPYAQPPIGDLRFRYPVVPPAKKEGIQLATQFSPSCPQQIKYKGNYSNFPLATLNVYVPSINSITYMSEDCLTVNIQMPKGTKPDAKLPILFFIHGGAFEVGGSVSFDATDIVHRSIIQEKRIIFVSINYRLNAFGFLGGKEVAAAGLGNLGLVDQREALRFVNKYADLFGGDKNKVTIMGNSAGAQSVAAQMLTNKGNAEGLFRAAYMQSGSASPLGSIEQFQTNFDHLVSDVGCKNNTVPLDCLRTVSYQSILDSVNSLPGIFSYVGSNHVYSASADGKFLTAPPQQLIARGEYAKIPQIHSNTDDEGTRFSMFHTNVTTDAHFRKFITDIYLPTATSSEIDSLLLAYTNDTSSGSPFNTGKANAYTPQFKRISAVQGDIFFQSARRYFLGISSGTVPVWSTLWTRNKATPYLGSFHTSDQANAFYSPGVGSIDKQLIDYLINFVVNLNPNDSQNPNLINWPQYTNQSRTNLEVEDIPSGAAPTGPQGLKLSMDDFRASAIDLVISLFLKYPVHTTY